MNKFPVGATIILCLAALFLYTGFVMLFANGDVGSLLVGIIISGIFAIWGLKLLRKNLYADKKKESKSQEKKIQESKLNVDIKLHTDKKLNEMQKNIVSI